jgi:SAM-dependent methyltransferase
MDRDTDRDWQVIGEHQPFFGVLSNEQYLAQNLTPEAIDQFFATGRADIEHAVGTLNRLAGGSFAPKTALDFGSGVGRLAFAMAAYAHHVIGVDVSDGMRAMAEQQVARRGITNVEFAAAIPEIQVDWVNSLIVFQHIPPARGHELFERLVTMLAPNGFLSLQLTFFRDTRHVGEVARDLGDYRYDGERIELLGGAGASGEAGSMSMYDYDLNRVFRTLFINGFSDVHVEHTDHGGCHGAYIFGVRRA